jgi:tetratricopeptide (TPR) repeat protein
VHANDVERLSQAPHSTRPSERHLSRRYAAKVDRLLLAAVLTAIGLVLVLMGWVVYSVLVPVSAPRTEAERQVMKLEELSKTQPRNASVWADWAKALVAVGEYSKAADVIERGSREASQSAPIMVVKAQMLLREGNPGQALSLLQGVIADLEKLESAEIKRMAARGTSMTESTLYSSSIVDARILEGEILLQTGRAAEAERAYTLALQRRPDMADVLVARGDAYAKLGKRAEAVGDYRKALTMIPGYQPALDGLNKLGEAATP